MNIKLSFANNEFDILAESGGIATGDDLFTAVVLSLFSWRRARPDDELMENAPRYGWWGDVLSGDKIGSRLWLLQRSKMLPSTITSAVGYIREALQWMIDDGLATKIDVEPERNGLDRLDILIKVYQGQDVLDVYFGKLWGAMLGNGDNTVQPIPNVYKMEDFYYEFIY